MLNKLVLPVLLVIRVIKVKPVLLVHKVIKVK